MQKNNEIAIPRHRKTWAFLQKFAKNERSNICWDAIRYNYPESVISKFPWRTIAKKPVRTRSGRHRIQGCSAFYQRKSGMMRTVSEGFSGYQLCFRENQHWNSSDSALIFCSEFLVFQRYFRENQHCSALNQLCFGENQRWFSADFGLWNLGFSALFIDFQVLNSAETDLKFLWIRADQRWVSLRRQPGIVFNIISSDPID